MVLSHCRIGPVRAPSKSTLDRYGRFLPEEKINQLGAKILQHAAQDTDDNSLQVLGLEEGLDLANVWFDSFCLKANIHFPTDCVLLIDATRTLMKATVLIRKSGLKKRMPQSSDEFLRDMNKLGIAMAQQKRKKDSKRSRKKILRLMKKAIRKTLQHAEKHRELLAERWQETELSRAQAQQIIDRIDGILVQLLDAEKQALERVIGGRQVKSSEKILSLYEKELQVVVRGKLGSEVKFGNQFLLGEQEDGLILHHQLNENVVNDSRTLIEGVETIEERLEFEVEGVCADRGFGSKANEEWLEEADFVCPQQIEALRERMENVEFARRQKRRSQTEGRISIFVHRFLSRRPYVTRHG